MIAITIKRVIFAATVALGCVTLGCPSPHPDNPNPAPTPNALTVKYLDQGWSPEIRQRFHYTSQGSELIPYYWFLNLLEPDGKTLFKDDLVKYGMLFDPGAADPQHLNPDNLPIGFARQDETETINGVKEAHWLGMTCAACHTGAFTYQAKPADTTPTTVIVDGAPSSSDLGAFLQDLGAAVQATNSDPQKLQALAAKVVAAGDGASTTDVEARFKQFAAEFAKIVKIGTPTNPWGPGRVDAFGVILDRACDYDLPNSTDKILPPDAPVSYPFLWYSDRQDRIQWHGEVPNQDWFHRLGRNTGEVVGVFARIDVRPGAKSYVSSVNPVGLGLLDKYVVTLKAPAWKDVFPAPDPALVAKGQTLFRENCGKGWCHQDVAAPGKALKMKPTPLLPDLNTDDAMTRLVHTRTSPTAGLAGTRALLIVGSKFGATAPAADIVGNIGAGALLHKKRYLLAAYIDHLLTYRVPKGQSTTTASASDQQNATAQATTETTDEKIAQSYKVIDPTATGKTQSGGFDPTKDGYESRPLAGIWATAPFLHNGSVPNLYELLSPDKREATFYVGALAYDPVKVGYISDGKSGGKVYDTKLPGNSNQGHTYGWKLADADKNAIIEYLKSL
jgi:hypothetical protein